MIARHLTRLIKAFNFKPMKPAKRELRALKRLVTLLNSHDRCVYCGVHREKGWMEKHDNNCKLWKQLSQLIER
jgi:hypothetical protein